MKVTPRCPVKADEQYGLLTTISRYGVSNDGHTLWLCQCQCGNQCVKQSNNLKSSHTPSCNCKAKEASRSAATVHGMHRTRTYSSWQAMITRCHNNNAKDFKRYGAVGILVCQRWKCSFENFFLDMGERPLGKTLDRIKNDQGYSPDNCKWSTPIEQARNRKRSIEILWDGIHTPLAVVAAKVGITYGAAYQRLRRGALV